MDGERGGRRTRTLGSAAGGRGEGGGGERREDGWWTHKGTKKCSVGWLKLVEACGSVHMYLNICFMQRGGGGRTSQSYMMSTLAMYASMAVKQTHTLTFLTAAFSAVGGSSPNKDTPPTGFFF